MSDPVKFDPEKGWPEDTVETRIASGIWRDICGRGGLDLYAFDDEIQEEIYSAWLDIIRKAMAGRPT